MVPTQGQMVTAFQELLTVARESSAADVASVMSVATPITESVASSVVVLIASTDASSAISVTLIVVSVTAVGDVATDGWALTVRHSLLPAASLAQTLGMTVGNFLTNAGVLCGQTRVSGSDLTCFCFVLWKAIYVLLFFRPFS